MKTTLQKTITAITLIATLLLAAANAAAETTITYLVNDGLGSPIAAMDEQGAIVWRKDYQPYGNEYTQHPAATDERIGYTGHVQDRSSGLTYMGARYYDPMTGRFMAADPVGFDESNPMSFSRYAYANSNPYRFVDPDGGTPVDSLLVLLYPAGRAIGGIAAYTQGVITGDQSLANIANAGLASDRNENIGALGLAATVFFLPPGAGSLEKGGAVAKGPLWSSTKSNSAVENAFGHFKKHKSEFPEFQNAKQYVEGTKKFLNSPPKGTLSKTNSRGDTLRYNPDSNTLGVLSKNGAPRTMFRPKDGIDYWNRQ